VKNFCQDDAFSVMKCKYIKFLNLSRQCTRTCGTSLSQQIDILSVRAESIYLFAGF
jgi:hypothetical protein